MRKLSLKLDDLSVESFETVRALIGAGTVQAYETFDSECQCSDLGSCDGGCGSGDATCGCDTDGFTCKTCDTVATVAVGVNRAY
jgi:hypothetical protein